MVFVGGSAAVSALLVGSPSSTVQALRYALAAAVLAGLARVSRRRVLRPRGREWAWLAGVAVAGLVVFNVALVHGARHAEPAVFGVAVASVPLVLALLGPLLDGRTTGGAVWLAAGLVTAGAVLVVGFGRADAVGVAWAVVVLVCEAAFTLLAVPVLGRLGPWGVSVHTTWMAAAAFGVLGVVTEGPLALNRLGWPELAAGAYLSLGVTALAFVCWYGAVARLGAGRAGLLTGIAPVAAAAVGVALGEPWPGPAVWVGILVVATGLVVGLARPADDALTGATAAPVEVAR
ncbi:Threonine/homoserine efflux transporter RhtA [Klenkia soli]|uniref:Threonine/homoserine efflux transporter RhtA n=2 Tax=Klenkia soli TaxID=1052260 RepID=A0A1H0FVF6_9ACTN|nr:Threonine/homoserine efflux transporter RhtA [Klenkia soli]